MFACRSESMQVSLHKCECFITRRHSQYFEILPFDSAETSGMRLCMVIGVDKSCDGDQKMITVSEFDL